MSPAPMCGGQATRGQAARGGHASRLFADAHAAAELPEAGEHVSRPDAHDQRPRGGRALRGQAARGRPDDYAAAELLEAGDTQADARTRGLTPVHRPAPAVSDMYFRTY